MNLNTKLIELKGIGPKKQKLFEQLRITTLEDLLENSPRDYENRANFKKLRSANDGEKATFVVSVKAIVDDRYVKRKMHMLSFIVEDSSGEAKITFFNSPFLKKSIRIGEEYLVYGKVSFFKNTIQISSPKMELKRTANTIGSIIPIYNLTKGISNQDILNNVNKIVDLNLFNEIIPIRLVEKYGLMDKNAAIKQIHFPENLTKLIAAKQRLAYEEFLSFQIKILSQKIYSEEIEIKPYKIDKRVTDFINSLSFKLTDGQKEALDEIFNDFKSGKKMNRLLQGDVGSGKTIVAIISMYVACINGYQSTIMAPTEILARQHLESFRNLFDPLGVKVELLVGSTSMKNRNRILSGIANGEIDILIGTHALIEDNVEFYNLGLNITDEQHRFGVRQREKLNTKSDTNHVLVMTATPIPRTLALVLYSDLDISTINTLPPNRKQIETTAIGVGMLERALDFIRSEINNGRQAYIVCPLIEEGALNLNSATDVYNDIKEHFKDVRVGLLHGRMAPAEKENIMLEFKERKLDILVSTTVIEVGVNVPNATVMLVYNAERFGLAQLHQLRGRVGRGEHKSYCILFNSSKSEISWERMKVMTNSTDGFYIANEDLRLRGGGDLFGTRQSGLMNFKFADIMRDYKILKIATNDAKEILEMDPELKLKENLMLKKEIEEHSKSFKMLN
ncbi:MAG: ATP-dependent DNA helicase RecG [Peptoniphilus sp.]|uniref:ATP-dependent DNA helicase RecG n=1 Tax=Peptoniphilus sp. TaxID=1971214 RepID=UPI002A747370|nr:ATP-dependent DNA helicase RecG [Peptoniphilus sp.]MDY2987203.1 ATP-dependent DNA helicase RecG [Peptoniphilus sp.]